MAGKVHDGRFHAHIRRATIENQVDSRPEFGADMVSARRAEATEAVRRWRDDAITERRQQCMGNRMARHAERDRCLPARDKVEDMCGARQHQCQRAGPECLCQPDGGRGHMAHPSRHRVRTGEVDDHRVVGGASLRGEEAADRFRVARVRPEAIDRLGRERDQAPGPENCHCCGDVVGQTSPPTSLTCPEGARDGER